MSYNVKWAAKQLKKLTGMRLCECYEKIAHDHGYSSWNHMAASMKGWSYEQASTYASFSLEEGIQQDGSEGKP